MYDEAAKLLVLHFNGADSVVQQVTSADNGKHWSSITEIGKSVLAPTCDPSTHAGPGRGLQLSASSAAPGRLLMVGWDGKYPDPKRRDCVWYSDDHSKTWKLSSTTIPLMNEAQIAEVPAGAGGATEVYFNSRTRGNITGKPAEVRATARSTDGGDSFALPVVWDAALPEPGHGCMGSSLGLPAAKPSLAYYSSPDSKSRSNMTIRRSVDGARTWSSECVVHPGPSAYSCLTELPDAKRIGILHERDAPACAGPSCQTVFSTFTLELKTDDALAKPPPKPRPCHHGGSCTGSNATPPHLRPRLHNTPDCLQTSGPHDMAATITLPHADGGVVHHVFQFCIPCLYTSPEETCFYKQGNSNPNSPNGTWALNNVGDAWTHSTSRDLVSWENHGNNVDGSAMYLWRAKSQLSPPTEWHALGSMFTTKDDAMVKNSSRAEMVTPSYTGNIAGDPKGGETRLLTNNGTSQCAARNTMPTCHTPGLAAMNGVVALASNQSVAWDFIDALWQLPIPSGDNRDSDRYYSGSLYLEALLRLSGNYRAWGCDTTAGSANVKTDDGASDDIIRLWPRPTSLVLGTGAVSIAQHFDFEAASQSASDILLWNIKHYKALLFARNASGAPGAGDVQLRKLKIQVKQPCDDDSYPSLAMDESYTLSVSPPSATLTAASCWGAIRGLETFTQLLTMNGAREIQQGNGLQITDAPRFKMRGLMLDPARHFLSVAEVTKTIDAMAQNKLNTLHFHLTDGESFTVNTEAWANFTNLSFKGAFAPQVSYTKADLKAIVAHGRLRGVRIVPEFDLPAHMASWAQGYPGLITDCPSENPHPEWYATPMCACCPCPMHAPSMLSCWLTVLLR